MERNISDISGLQNIRSMRSTGKNSIPKNQNSTYLDLYMLNKKGQLIELKIVGTSANKSILLTARKSAR
jgi:hypothetical protein